MPTSIDNHTSRTRRRVAGHVAILAVAAALFGGHAGEASADPTAVTDDKSVSVPTAWWTAPGVTGEEIADLLDANGARLTDIEVYSASEGTFAVTMVKNAGAYWVPYWWWYYDKTEADVKSLLALHNARLIDIDAYQTSAGTRFAVVMVANTGQFAKSTKWDAGVTSASISSVVGNGSAWRLVDLESYMQGSVKRYAFLAVANTGSDSKTWQWWLNQTPSSIASKVKDYGGRITDLERQPNGTYNFIQVKNAGADNKHWGFYFGLANLGYAAQVAGQYAVRLLDVETYVAGGKRRYDAVVIDNANAATRRITNLFAPTFTGSNGLPKANFGAYVKRVGGAVGTSLQPNRQFEPASAIKAVVNLETMQRIDSPSDPETLGSGLTFFNYPNSPYNAGTKDACAIPGDEIGANQVTTTVDWAKDQMMSISDNRTTRAFMLRYGMAALNAAAQGAGMTSTEIGQDQPGCSWLGNKRNLTTLADLGRLYEGVENGSLLSASARTEFYQPMNGGSFALNSAIAGVVQQEAAKQGKSGIAGSFVSQMSWRLKGGGYDIPCSQPLAGCGSGYLYFRSMAGRLTLPVKTRTGAPATRTYVFGRYVDSLHAGCTGCTSVSAANTTLGTVTTELFREVIASALKTW